MTLSVKHARILTKEEDERLFHWRDDVFGLHSDNLSWELPADLHLLAYADDELVSHVGLLRQEIRVAGESLLVGGVGGVVTVPEAQSNGFARLLMQHATDFIASEWKVDAGLLFCDPWLSPYYASLGWQDIVDPVIVEQPNGPIPSPASVMVLPIGRRLWPRGVIEIPRLPW